MLAILVLKNSIIGVKGEQELISHHTSDLISKAHEHSEIPEYHLRHAGQRNMVKV